MTADVDYTVTAERVIAASGLTFRKYDNWVRVGYLRPVVEANGCGSKRRFTPDELRVAVTMARLVDAGLTVAAAQKVARGEAELAPGVRVEVTP